MPRRRRAAQRKRVAFTEMPSTKGTSAAASDSSWSSLTAGGSRVDRSPQQKSWHQVDLAFLCTEDYMQYGYKIAIYNAMYMVYEWEQRRFCKYYIESFRTCRTSRCAPGTGPLNSFFEARVTVEAVVVWLCCLALGRVPRHANHRVCHHCCFIHLLVSRAALPLNPLISSLNIS